MYTEVLNRPRVWDQVRAPQRLAITATAFMHRQHTPFPAARHQLCVVSFAMTAVHPLCARFKSRPISLPAAARCCLQDLYGKVMVKCTALHELRWQVLDPRLFQSACFPGCGCSFSDSDMTDPERVGKFAKGHRPDRQGRCSPEHFSSWLMRHFPCSGLTHQKAKLMTGLMEGFFNSTSAVITRNRRRQ